MKPNSFHINHNILVLVLREKQSSEEKEKNKETKKPTIKEKNSKMPRSVICIAL